MEEFVAYLVKNMVGKPELVEVRSSAEPSSLVITIRVAPEDVGKVVGRKGNVIRSIRTLAGTIGARFGCRVQLDVVQPQA